VNDEQSAKLLSDEQSRRVYPATAELIAEALGADPRTLGQRAGAISLPSQGQRQFP
jgi:hypothetical protein